MIIKINFGSDLLANKTYLRVDYYRSKEAFNQPLDYPQDCFTCSTELHEGDFEPVRLMGIVEVLINNFLSEKCA